MLYLHFNFNEHDRGFTQYLPILFVFRRREVAGEDGRASLRYPPKRAVLQQ
jgi:hypothetical protein